MLFQVSQMLSFKLKKQTNKNVVDTTFKHKSSENGAFQSNFKLQITYMIVRVELSTKVGKLCLSMCTFFTLSVFGV